MLCLLEQVQTAQAVDDGYPLTLELSTLDLVILQSCVQALEGYIC